VSNGLGSPLCKGALGVGELSSADQRDCETSGFVAAMAPTGNYGLDVHIDTGVLGISSGGLLTGVQDLFVAPVWMALVWAVHALVVMLEWCFTIDLLDSASAGEVGAGLRQVQADFTAPWLALVLALASVLALYRGLILRRVSETLGHALLMLAMTAGGMWVILDPTGTVGALGRWANQASLGTLAVTAKGRPTGAGRALADSMAGVFAAAIEVPWCYLEFGDVGWCRSPGRLDERLRATGLKIASSELATVGCKLEASPFYSCVAPGSEQAKALEHSAQLLRTAPNNGAIFLALPANGPARNSINEQGSLLRALCQGSEATNCHGPTAAQAEFRTNGGTWKRVGGLLLIVAGVLGILLLLGYIGLRLLGAAIFSLLLLLLAPLAVLAPALGESGRLAFRRWATLLLGSVVSKLLFSFLLGAVLAVLAILSNLNALGWWTQWLLMSAFWWGAFLHRHQTIGLARGALGGEQVGPHRSIARRAKEALQTPNALLRGAGQLRSKLSPSAPTVEQRRARATAGRLRAKQLGDAQVGRSLERELEEARARLAGGAASQARAASMGQRLRRLRRARAEAIAAGDSRRAASLGMREAAIAEGLAGEQAALGGARSVLTKGQRARLRTGENHDKQEREQRGRFLDAQAALPASGRAAGDGSRRDYASLAGLAGHGRSEYERLGPRAQREARLRIDRELATRRELGAAAADVALTSGADRPARRERRQGRQDLDRALGERLRASGHRQPPSTTASSPLDAWKRAGARSEQVQPRRRSSTVLDDAREVAARRKRQLGRDRP
jgi:hypothetical protein